jgi:hypothetical protein
LSGTVPTLARLADMPAIRVHLPTALRNEDIRHACCAVEAIFRAANLLDTLPPPALEQIRDYCSDSVKDRTGAFSAFKRAYINLVIEHLNDAEMRERRLFHEIERMADKPPSPDKGDNEAH